MPYMDPMDRDPFVLESIGGVFSYFFRGTPKYLLRDLRNLESKDRCS